MLLLHNPTYHNAFLKIYSFKVKVCFSSVSPFKSRDLKKIGFYFHFQKLPVSVKLLQLHSNLTKLLTKTEKNKDSCSFGFFENNLAFLLSWKITLPTAAPSIVGLPDMKKNILSESGFFWNFLATKKAVFLEHYQKLCKQTPFTTCTWKRKEAYWNTLQESKKLEKLKIFQELQVRNWIF